jgi:hypothetical protein
MTQDKNISYFMLMLVVLILISAFFAYYKYMVKEDFVYFIAEESVPDRFDINSYK